MSKQTENRITEIMQSIEKMLIAKNRAYGDSALEPVRVFSKTDTIEQLYVRIDDKLSRIQRGYEYPGDDTIFDLVGYLVLLLIAKERNERV
jgi:prophage maintenance system killer protein